MMMPIPRKVPGARPRHTLAVHFVAAEAAIPKAIGKMRARADDGAEAGARAAETIDRTPMPPRRTVADELASLKPVPTTMASDVAAIADYMQRRDANWQDLAEPPTASASAPTRKRCARSMKWPGHRTLAADAPGPLIGSARVATRTTLVPGPRDAPHRRIARRFDCRVEQTPLREMPDRGLHG